MAKVTRSTLKTYFETGDQPTESEFTDLIDSNLNLSENNTGDIQLTGNITASGDISASGTVFANNFSSTGGNTNGIDFTDDLNLTGNLTASGNISASGNVTGEDLISSNLTSGRITLATTGGRLADNSKLTFANNILTTDDIKVTNISASGNITSSNLIATGSEGNITASGNISASGTIVASNFSGNSSGTNTGDQSLAHLAITGSNVTFANLTASNLSVTQNTIVTNLTASIVSASDRVITILAVKLYNSLR